MTIDTRSQNRCTGPSMPFDPPPTDFASLQAAYQRIILERDALQRRVARLVSDNAYLHQQVNELTASVSAARGEW